MREEIDRIEFMRYATTIIPDSELETLYRKNEIKYPKELTPKYAQFFQFELYDYRWGSFYTKVAAKTSMDKGDSVRTPSQRAIDNFYGLMGEKAVKDILRFNLRLLFHWNEREPTFFKQIYKEPFDIATPTKHGGYHTLEIKTTKEPNNYVHMIIPEGTWKLSTFAIAVKMLRFDLRKKKRAYGFIAGYLEKAEIEKIPVTPKGEYPCFEFAGRAKKLLELHPISELWEKMQNECIAWESA